VTVAEVHQAMVQVALVGDGERLAASGPSHDGEQQVEHGDAEDEQRQHERGEEEVRLADELRVGVGATADDAGRHGEQQAQQDRAGVAHDDPRRVEVVGQEAEAQPDGDDRDEWPDVRR